VIDINQKDDAVTFRVRAQPRAPRTEIVGEHSGAIKLRLSSPPVDGKANEECRRFLARLVGVSASSVEIVSGDASRDKVIRIRGVGVERVSSALRAVIQE
jgi:hypothetical protein